MKFLISKLFCSFLCICKLRFKVFFYFGKPFIVYGFTNPISRHLLGDFMSN